MRSGDGHDGTATVRIGALATVLALSVPPPANAFDVQGHRGARGISPENTLPGFIEAMSAGVTTLEMDLQLTADDIVVVFHDRRLNGDIARAASGTYLEGPFPRIRDLTLSDVKSFDVGRIRPGSPYAARFPRQNPVVGARIPTLSEVVALTNDTGNPQVRFNIEIKYSPEHPDDTAAPEHLVARTIAEITALRIVDRTTVQAFDWNVLDIVARVAPDVRRAYLTSQRIGFDTIGDNAERASAWTGGRVLADFGGSVPAMVRSTGGHVWSPHHADVTRHLVDEAHRLGLKVIPWTVNRPEDMFSMIDADVDGMISDYPDRLISVLAVRGISPGL
jgi:glycerophosphoryl diester phosphodiesterase